MSSTSENNNDTDTNKQDANNFFWYTIYANIYASFPQNLRWLQVYYRTLFVWLDNAPKIYQTDIIEALAKALLTCDKQDSVSIKLHFNLLDILVF